MSIQTVHFDLNITEFPLVNAIYIDSPIAYFYIYSSTTVTVEAVNAIVKDASSFTITNDSTVGTANIGYQLNTNVSLDKDTGYITFTMKKKDAQTLLNESLQAQIVALGKQVVALTVS